MSGRTLILDQLKNFSFDSVIQQLSHLKQQAALDDRQQDTELVMALTNLISIEEHLAFTGAKTQKNNYYELIKNIQTIKKNLLTTLKINPNIQAIAERFLAASMRLMEVGTKQLCLKDKTVAAQFFQQAYQFYLLFEGLRQNLITSQQVSNFDEASLNDLQRYLASFFTSEPAQAHHSSKDSKHHTPRVKIQDLNTFVEKADAMKKQHQLDLSSDQDLTLAIMNLIVIEEDLFFLGAKMDNDHYYEALCKTREIRKTLLQKLITHYEGEVWCISKHLLSASMRTMQVGFQLTEKQTPEEASQLFEIAYHLYSLFWGINLGIIGDDTTKKTRKSFMGKLGVLVKKAIDCCIE